MVCHLLNQYLPISRLPMIQLLKNMEFHLPHLYPSTELDTTCLT